MKNIFKCTTILIISLIYFSSCGPARVDKYQDIKANETAFVTPMEGANKTNQKKFMSLDYLKESKVAQKRIFIPQKKVKTGRLWVDYKWIPTIKIITVNRSPVTREWTKDNNTGSSVKDQAFLVESRDSISFRVGCNCTASILEDNTPLFLYYFSTKDLSEIMDTNIRQYVQAMLSKEFGKLDLGGNRSTSENNIDVKTCRNSKAEIFDKTFIETKKHFKEMGITIDSLGMSEGLTFIDKEIQITINDTFKAEMNIEIARSEKNAQTIINKKNEDIARSKRLQAEEFAKAAEAQIKQVNLDIEKMKAEATLNASKKWSGNVPSKILPSGSGFLFGLD